MKLTFSKYKFETFFLIPTIVKAPIPNGRWGICWLHSAIWIDKQLFNYPLWDINISNMEEISFKVILRGKELDKAEEYLYSIKNAIKEDIVEQNCEFEDFDVVITE